MKKIIYWGLVAVMGLGVTGCDMSETQLDLQSWLNGTGQPDYKVKDDKTAPVIVLRGAAVMTVTQGDTFTDPGAVAYDKVDGRVNVTVSGSVDTSKVGTYILTYSATDRAGNTAGVTRTVKVVPKVTQNSDTTPPVITLRGDAQMSVNQGDSFTDPGATAYDDKDGRVNVTVSGSVDTSKVGTYTLTYSAQDSAGNRAEAKRTVKVLPKDTTPPVLTLRGNAEMTITQGDSFTDPGATAYDDKDGKVNVTVSGSVDTSRVGTYTLTYSARDKAGNEAYATRKVKVVPKVVENSDTTPPVISLKGAKTMTVTQGDSFTDPGASAYDDQDGNVNVTVSGRVDTSKVGTYTLTYTATDNAGNRATATRTVKVVKKEVNNNTKADVRKGPYVVYDGVPTEMKVLWQLKSTQKCTIDWGTDSGSSQERSSGYNGHLHVYTIKNLVPDTIYNYSVSCDNGKVGSGSFHTAPKDDATNVNFFVYGDTRSNPRDHDRVVAQMIKQYENDTSFQTMVLHTGDFVSHGTRESDWDSQYFDPRYTHLHQFQSQMPIAGIRGNHEGDADLFIKYFPTKHAQGGYYYSFDYGPVHIAALDQYKQYGPGSTQYKWLENDLKNSTKKWKVIFLHEPGYSAGGHGNNSYVQNYIQPLAKKYGVSFIFSGHNHYYARAVVDGVQHVTAGGGGAPLYRPQGGEHIVKSKMVRHFCTIQIKDNQLLFTVIDENGNEIDSLSLNK